jgi:hypothetical protein
MISVPYGDEDPANVTSPRVGWYGVEVLCAICNTANDLRLVGDVFLCRIHGPR